MIARTTVLQAESSAPVEQLTGPRVCGAQPVKSACRKSSPTVTATAIGISVVAHAVAVDHAARAVDAVRDLAQLGARDLLAVVEHAREAREHELDAVALAGLAHARLADRASPRAPR